MRLFVCVVKGFVIGNEPGYVVSGNQIYDNVITNSTGLPWENIPGEAIHDLYGGAPGRGNTFHDNILFGNPGGRGHLTHVRAYKNVHANPRLADPGQHDYQPQPAGPTASLNLWNGVLTVPTLPVP